MLKQLKLLRGKKVDLGSSSLSGRIVSSSPFLTNTQPPPHHLISFDFKQVLKNFLVSNYSVSIVNSVDWHKSSD